MNANDDIPDDSQEIEEQFESTPEEATSFGGSPKLNRKMILMAVAAIFVVVVLATALVPGKPKKSGNDASQAHSATAPRDFLERERDRSLRGQEENTQAMTDLEKLAADYEAGLITSEEYYRRLRAILGAEDTNDEYGLPLVTSVQAQRPPPPPVQYYPPPPDRYQSNERESQPQLSSLRPRVEGSMFASSSPPPSYQASAGMEQDPYYQAMTGMPDISELIRAFASAEQPVFDPYAAQNNQANKNAFYGGGTGGALSGFFLQDDTLWIGTVIPAVLETAINTDLPGNVIARVTQNIYDSRTGRRLLIPQGSILVAQYNNSVSYAQKRVQIVWDVLIRPDGYMLELEGMNGVDPRGMAGLKAVYRENWFEYVKAAGIITLFSLANGKMVEQVAKYGSDEIALGVVTSNAEFIREVGGNLISRALNIQPTLTVDSGEVINIMLNKNLHLPPVQGYPVTERYIRR